jgi:hypothetical protein
MVEEPGLWVAATSLLLFVAACWALYATRRRVVPESPDGWRPAFPGVETPPPGSTSRVAAGAPGWWCAMAVAVALAGFVAASCLAE